MTESPYKDIKSEHLRQLLLRVADGVFWLWPLLTQVNAMVRAEEACLWLIKNRLTGQNLYGLWTQEYKMSALKVIARINQGLERDDKMRNVRVGRDIL